MKTNDSTQASISVEEHKARHKLLHECLDELLADYLSQHDGSLPSTLIVLDLLRWSNEQTKNPTERRDI